MVIEDVIKVLRKNKHKWMTAREISIYKSTPNTANVNNHLKNLSRQNKVLWRPRDKNKVNNLGAIPMEYKWKDD